MPTHGSANKKMKAYPNILKYVEAHYPKLYEIMDDADVLYLIKRSRYGLTFLVPDEKTTTELQKILESDDPEIVKDVIQSITIPMFLPNVETWKKYQDKIPSYANKKIEIKSVDDKGVTLKNGTVIVPDKKFVLFKARSGKKPQMAVWTLKGKVDYEGAPDMDISEIMKSMKGKAVEKKVGSAEHDDLIESFIAIVENREYKYYAAKEKVSCKLKVLCNYACLLNSMEDDEAKKNLTLLANTFNPEKPGDVEANFYIHLNACNRTINGSVCSTLISPAFIARMIGNDAETSRLLAGGAPNPMKKLMQTLKEYKVKATPSETLDFMKRKPGSVTPQSILDEYKQIINGYGDEGCDKIMKDEFQKRPSMLLLIHETKFYFSEQYKLLMRSFGSKVKEYTHFMNNISTRKYVCDKGITMFRMSMDNKNKFINEFIDYVQNTLHIYGADDDSEENEQEQGDSDTYNKTDVKISDCCLQEVENYINEHGKLPERISELLK